MMSRARLLKRVSELDMEHCPSCGGELKIITASLETPVIERILEHIGLPARALPRETGPCLDAASGLTGFTQGPVFAPRAS